MGKIKSKIILLLIIFLGLCFWFFTGNYHFNPLEAAKAHFDVGKDAVTVGDVDFGWSKVYVFNTARGPRTVISIKSWFLWRAPAAVHLETSTDAIRTVGWMSYTDDKGQATVFAVETSDPNITSVEVGPPNQRIMKDIKVSNPIFFSWNTGMQLSLLKPIAFSKDGTPLFEYRYPKNTNVTRSEELKWYSVSGDK
ncbi:hypothetical protein [Desulfosporosinus nitroreducens]|uniref:hypothetical protein n=1 Tax=Desulfosporosinus nitroreducens TaxID=2018668 RepID=UPI00207C5C0F|nr:hypothetical protein [Desulfosporosinus nitroreducens]MCO1604690.1 hypothetical protein [Desulfosporosinus nitroreducens]